MQKIAKVLIISVIIWLTGFYSYALVVMSWQKHDSAIQIMSDDSNNYWSPNPSLVKSYGGWDSKVWKWREFLGCGSMQITDADHYNYVEWSDDHSVRMNMLTKPDMDWVYVAGISVGSVWDDLKPSYQPLPLKVNKANSLLLETRIDDWKGTPLSPIVFPSWYAVLTDVWFNVTDVTIEDENGTQQFPSKILGIDIFYYTMTGSLNAVMGGSNEFARVEPCNKNFIYSVNLADQNFYSNSNGLFTVDLYKLLQNAQEEAAKHDWHFDIDNVELMMLDSVIESYWSYIYAKISWSGIRYCLHGKDCAIE